MLRLTRKLPAEDMKRLMLEHIVITDDDLRVLARRTLKVCEGLYPQYREGGA